jgi:hypothetical protein
VLFPLLPTMQAVSRAEVRLFRPAPPYAHLRIAATRRLDSTLVRDTPGGTLHIVDEPISSKLLLTSRSPTLIHVCA